MKGVYHLIGLTIVMTCPVVHTAAKSAGIQLASLNMSMADFVDDLLSRRGYEKRIRPGADTGNSALVFIDIFIVSISAVDDFNMDYSIDMYLRQTWTDSRLSFSRLNTSVTLNYDQINRIWIPDTFFRNLKKGMFHDITVPNRLIRLSPQGEVLFSQRLSLTFDCQMYLEKYPMDNQTCSIDIGSYGYTKDDMDLIWQDKKKPVSYKKGLELPEFIIQAALTYNCTANFSTGEFACIYANLHFKRRFAYHLIQTYVPSTLIVMLSWVSFWIDTDAVPARISLGLLTVLTITTMASGTAARLPKVSYVKALDMWMVACLLFVFGALIEYSAVNVLSRKRKNDLSKKMDEAQENSPWFNVLNASATMALLGNKNKHMDGSHIEEDDQSIVTEPEKIHPHNINSCMQSEGPRPEDLCPPPPPPRSLPPVYPRSSISTSSRGFSCFFWMFCPKLQGNAALLVDLISRVLFPSMFVMFNAYYWCLYCVPSPDIMTIIED